MLGLDLANVNGPVPLQRLRGGPYRFCYHKRTEGTGFLDELYLHHRELARAAGLAFGPYMYARLREPARAQIDFLFQHYKPRTGDLVVMIDVEQTGNEGVAPEHARDWTREAVKLLRGELGQWPGVYTSPRWWDAHVAPGAAELHHCPLWDAHYFVPTPALPREWRHVGWTLWQRADNATIAGHHPVDLDQARRLPRLQSRRLLHPRPVLRAVRDCEFIPV